MNNSTLRTRSLVGKLNGFADDYHEGGEAEDDHDQDGRSVS